MKLKTDYLFILLSAFFFLGCEKEEEFIISPGVIYNSTEAINRFEELDQQGVLIVNSYFNKDIFHLILENQDTLKVDGRIVETFQPKPAEWNAELIFRDGKTGIAPYLGNTLDILPDSVQVNPSGYGPLSALINITMPAIGKFKFRVVGKNGSKSDITHTPSNISKVHRLNIFGLYGNHENTVEVSFFGQ
ncbi:aryl-sulfate sulfotransferase N-terminal domain-containing protein [Algoriphagus boritolerans]|uniref:aryl-sulfate sulfotransferase N-terminal domain-containing protein n=1 Tax=Algoriphagus boritolerans TaxID=308111 RepID=UPI000A914828